MEQEWHAFFSNKQLEIIMNNDKNSVYTNIYKLKENGINVETTCVYPVSKYKNKEECNILFNDAKYLGVVNKWVMIGKRKNKVLN
tara:strand:+ start:516 stop:770 length:255 start_codon:yes stop_codon:yes gene_type:complete